MLLNLHCHHNPRLIASALLMGAIGLILLTPDRLRAADTVTHYLADGFDFPVGKPNATGYYKARGFWPNGHLGEDWNGRGGGNTDLGDPVYSMGHGVVVYSADFKAGWGNVIIVRHAYREKNGRVYFVDSLYGHLQRRQVRVGQKIKRGEKIGTIGRGPYNMYYAHLHFEIRKNLSIGMERSKYKRDYSNYHSPTHFINANRRLRQEFRQYRIPVNTFGKGQSFFTRNSISLPNMRSDGTIRPNVPRPVKDVIDRHGASKPPGPLKKFWEGLKKTLGFDK